MKLKHLILAPLLCSAFAASAQEGDIVRDGEYRFLEAQQGEAWAEQDARVEARLAEIRDENGGKPPSIDKFERVRCRDFSEFWSRGS